MAKQIISRQKTSTNYYILLPLSVAVSGLMLTGCMTPPLVTAHTSTVVNDNANNNYQYNSMVTDSLLDEDNLLELAELLEAKDMTIVENDKQSIKKSGDLWSRIRNGYGISRVNSYNPKIEAQKSWFIKNQNHLNKMAARASRYLHYTVTEAEKRGLPTEVALLPIIESSYDPSVMSGAKAAGLWQFIPSTGKGYGLNQTSAYDGRLDVLESTSAAYEYLKKLYNRYGDWELALAAYNAGPSRVDAAIEKNRRQGKSIDFWSLTSLPRETQNYVPRFLAVSQIIGNPQIYSIRLPAIADKQHFDSVPVSTGVRLSDVANIIGVQLEELQNLNPGMLSGKVEVKTPQRVIVPTGLDRHKINQIKRLSSASLNYAASSNPMRRPQPFIANPSSSTELKNNRNLPFSVLNKSNGSNPANKSVYVVQANDTLDSIAKRAGISREKLAQWNGLNTDVILLPNTSLSLYDARYTPTKNQIKSQNHPNNPIKSHPQSYKVGAGDTLITTARHFGLSRSQLASYNNISTDAYLIKGQRLWLVPGKVKSTMSGIVSSNSNNTLPRKSLSKTTSNYKGTTTRYQVKSGDTLLGIANRHGTTGSILAALNDVGVDYMVKTYEYLTVPVPSNSSSNKSNTTRSAKSSIKKSTASTEHKKYSTKKSNIRAASYKVRSGDTLTGVANSFGVNLRALASANNLAVNSQLQKGKVLLIPTVSYIKSVDATTDKKKIASSVTQRNYRRIRSTENYQVRSGDSLTALARRYNISVPELAKLNNFAMNSDLLIGQIVKVPASSQAYTVRSGDSLTGLAGRYNITMQKLASLNGLATNTMLTIGDTIKVPN